MTQFKPFMKCPGGKSKLIPELISRFPKDFEQEKYSYVEPFLGGGALALHLLGNGFNPKKMYLNELNLHIYNLWKSVSYESSVEHVILPALDKLLQDHSEENFYVVRKSFNSVPEDFCVSTNQLRAAQFLYLNKNCFNGLIRFNSKGEFNSPIGNYSKPQGVDKENLLAVSKKLEKAHTSNLDFQVLFENLYKKLSSQKWERMLFYFDPPYIPLSATSQFTNYTPGGFSMYDQRRLKSVVDHLTDLGAKVIVSNSSSMLTKKLYSDYKIDTIKAARSINSNKDRRGKIEEVIIRNFK